MVRTGDPRVLERAKSAHRALLRLLHALKAAGAHRGAMSETTKKYVKRLADYVAEEIIP